MPILGVAPCSSPRSSIHRRDPLKLAAPITCLMMPEVAGVRLPTDSLAPGSCALTTHLALRCSGMDCWGPSCTSSSYPSLPNPSKELPRPRTCTMPHRRVPELRLRSRINSLPASHVFTGPSMPLIFKLSPHSSFPVSTLKCPFNHLSSPPAISPSARRKLGPRRKLAGWLRSQRRGIPALKGFGNALPKNNLEKFAQHMWKGAGKASISR